MSNFNENNTEEKMVKTIIPFEEAMKKSLAYFNGDTLAASAWLSKYALKNAKGELLESVPDEMHKRLSAEFARIESKYQKSTNPGMAGLSEYGRNRKHLDEQAIFEYLNKFRYIVPQGSVMAALGNPYIIASLSNCVVLPELYDSYGGIFFADQQLAQLFKRRCGVGLDISSLRPEGMHVSNSAGSTTGAVSFMERFSNTTREVAQNGRRGALMITMDVAHPDIEKFITIKQDLKKVTGANISIRLSDEFMNAVINEGEFTLKFPVDSSSPLCSRKINAADLWNKIIKCAHNTAEPGLIFWDRQHNYSTSSVYPGFKNVSTNPCSEIAMQGGDSCRLIAINLFSLVKNPFTRSAEFDYGKFYEVTYEAQRLMDDLVDLELEAIERIISKIKSDPEPDYIKDAELRTWNLLYESGKKGRRTGLGFTALADTIAALGFKYDSVDALKEVEKIMRTKCEAEFDSSIDLSIERGKFSDFDKSFEDKSEFIQMLEKEFPSVYSRMMKHGRRNISISTVAPTGTLSLLTQTSSGIEPVFKLSYKRRKKINARDKKESADFIDENGDAWKEFNVYHPKYELWKTFSDDKDIAKCPYFGSTASEIKWENRVRLQSIVQKYTTHSISSTINLPSTVSEKIVGEIYMNAWKKGLKGITVYREGSRSGVLVSEEEVTSIIKSSPAPIRPAILESTVLRFQNNEEKWIAYIGLLNNKPYEIFTGKAQDAFSIPPWIENGWIIKNKNGNGKSRYDFQYIDKEGYKVTIEGLSRSFDKEFWNYAKLISGVLRHGMPLQDVIHLISDLHLSNENINSWKAGVERALKRFVPNGVMATDSKCPDCGAVNGLVYEEGCLKCVNCGQTRCG